MLIVLLLVEMLMLCCCCYCCLELKLVSNSSLNLHTVLIVLLVVELGAVVEHQVQVGGRVALVHLEHQE